jgi:outer membrane biosynthesis protein TonB
MTASERNALIGAGVAHVVLLAALSVSWILSEPPLVPAEVTFPVDIVQVGETPAAPPPKPSIAAAPQETTAPEPSPVPPEPKAETPPPEPSPDAKPEPKPKPDKAPPKAETKALDTQRLDSLIDKALPKAKSKPLDTSKLAKEIADATPKAAPAPNAQLLASLAQAIQAQVKPCWNPPIAGPGSAKMTVLMHAEFNPDGSAAARPVIVSRTGPASRAFDDSTVRAVLRCAPLKLPPKLYPQWKSIEINFDPENMG